MSEAAFILRVPISAVEYKKLSKHIDRSVELETATADQMVDAEAMFVEWWLQDALRARGFTNTFEVTDPHISPEYIQFDIESKEDAALIRLFLGAENVTAEREEQ